MGGAGARLSPALREARATAEVRLLSAARDRRAGVAGLGLEPRAQPGRGRGCDLRHRDRPAPERAAAVGPGSGGRDRRLLDRVLPRQGRRRLALEPAAPRGRSEEHTYELLALMPNQL